MKKISDALNEIISGNSLLEMGMRHGILNLTQTAHFIAPTLAARLKKNVEPTAVTMALSRMQRQKAKRSGPRDGKIRLDGIAITPGLCVVTYSSTPNLKLRINAFLHKQQRKESFCAVTQGLQQCTLFLERSELKALQEAISEKPLRSEQHVASLAVTFQTNYAHTPGFFALIFQKLYLQAVNIVELASTSNELILYIHDRDVELAFETLYHHFIQRERTS